MADFSFSLDMDKIFPKGITDEKLAFEMIEAGQEVMLKAIQTGASEHQKNGDMYKSLRKSKPVIDRKGDAVGRIKFYGNSKVSTSKGGQAFDKTNWAKAFRIEYGRTGQNAKPFIRPAIKSCESAAKAAMQKVFNRRAAGGNSRLK